MTRTIKIEALLVALAAAFLLPLLCKLKEAASFFLFAVSTADAFVQCQKERAARFWFRTTAVFCCLGWRCSAASWLGADSQQVGQGADKIIFIQRLLLQEII